MGKDVIRLSIEKGIGEISHSFLALSPLAFSTHFLSLLEKFSLTPKLNLFFLLFLLGRFPNFSAQAREKKVAKLILKWTNGWKDGGVEDLFKYSSKFPSPFCPDSQVFSFFCFSCN